jgi:hypothetical protein
MTITRINIALAVAALVFLVFSVVQTNAMAAQTWRTKDVQSRLASLLDARNTLVAQQATLSDRQQLATLAQQAGMVPVPANTVVYVTQDHPVAAR